MLHLPFDKTKKRSYAKQIHRGIREKIVSGELKAGEALPSTRELSRTLCVARNTVLTAYDMLVSEGAVCSVAGSGFYVSPGVTPVAQSVPVTEGQTASLSDVAIPDQVINFDSGLPDLALFPREKWNRVVSRAFLDAPISALGYDDPQGRPELRSVLCTFLRKARGISCSPEQIMITSGAKQGLSLAAKCLLQERSEVWIENPSNVNVMQIFSYYTDKIVPFEVDEQGLRPDLFPEGGKPRLIFTTPSHQFPMGGILPMGRRMELIEFVRKSGAYLLEDDYDSEFTYDAPPSNALFELDDRQVIYVGTFSKVLFPSVRLGYLVLPLHLVAQMRERKRLADHHSNAIYQLALLRFLESGDYERHVRRMKRVYHKRRDLMVALLRSKFGSQVRLYGAAAGMHMVAELEGASFTEARVGKLLQKGIYVVPVARHSLTKGKHCGQVILGYSGLTQEKMEQGLQILKAEVENCWRSHAGNPR